MVSGISIARSVERLFTGLTEQAFQAELGIADSEVTAYVADLLTRFVSMDSLNTVPSQASERPRTVIALLELARQSPQEDRYGIYRHIGDFTLFWVGYYPESLQRIQSLGNGCDRLLDYAATGKSAYAVASRFESCHRQAESRVLERMSGEFDHCIVALRIVRKWCDEMASASNSSSKRDAGY